MTGQPRCTRCGAYLPSTPIRTIEDALECTGKVTLVEMSYSEAEIAILGPSYRGRTYRQPWATCGESVEHPAHRDVFDTHPVVRCTRCGAEHTL